MKKILLVLFVLIFGPIAKADSIHPEKNRPADFVNVKSIIPEIEIDMRYDGSHNFVGRRVQGYEAPVCLLTKPAAIALKEVEATLLPMGLTLKVYDCYRPQTAVNDFAAWAKDINNTKMHAEFYPHIDKRKLFDEGYIAYQSGHTRGSTMDLTIVPLGSAIPKATANMKLVSCKASKDQRFPDNSLDFGTGFDCFSPVSHPDYQNISAQAKANRLLLRELMRAAGFKPLDTEWWHFTLANEPYPNTYFDFPVKN